uniref:Radical SAM protein n=1 Tax=Caldimicrobium thiodismutans TaxID=1653476 RepID=A0A832LV08_9BACT
MALLFGPVRSRRLGLSLGLELVPKKICSMDCLYCEVGKTTNLTTERKAYYSWESIEKALYAAQSREETFDVLTITGSGEPTLNIYFEKTVKLAKELISKPVAVLTNSTTLEEVSIIEALAQVDLVLASLDSAREKSFKLVNRPAKGVSLAAIVEGLKTLKETMRGEMWLEVLLVKGINDSPEDIEALKRAIEYIKPHRVQLNTVVRPPAYAVARPLSWEELEEIKEQLYPYAEIITPGGSKSSPITTTENQEEALKEYLSRRPAPLEELIAIFGKEVELNFYLEKLVREGKIKKITHQGETFYIS